MAVWVLADVHLPFGNPKKTMEAFGPSWKDYTDRIQSSWSKIVEQEDLVLIPGDISWATNTQEALKDLDFLEALPGKKLLIRGNHDYWWPSVKKLQEILPPSIHFIHNNSFDWKEITFGGARLWDTYEYSFEDVIEIVFNPFGKIKTPEELKKEKEEGEKIFVRELQRLKLSLEKMNPKATHRIALTHYPPIGADLKPSRASSILEEYEIDICVFGHLHNVRENSLPFGKARGVRYIFASADYLHFTPTLVLNTLS